MGYRLNCLDEHIFVVVPKPLLTEFGIHYRLESCVPMYSITIELAGDDALMNISKG